MLRFIPGYILGKCWGLSGGSAPFHQIPVGARVGSLHLRTEQGLHGKQPVVPQKKKGKFKQLIEKAQEKAGAKPIK